MNRQQFLQEFLAALEPLSAEERQQISDYYEELICDELEQGVDEQEVLSKFGSPAEAAARFRAENPSSTEINAPIIPVSAEEEVHTLDLHAQNLSVRLVSGENPQLQIYFLPNPDRDRVESFQENGVWHFQHTMRKSFRGFFGFGMSGSREITVLVPKEFAGKLLIRTTNAKISGGDFQRLSMLHAVTGNASIEIENIHPKTCILKTSNAPIRARRIETEELECTTSNSRMEGVDISADKQVWKTWNGSIHLANLTGTCLSAVTSNARITAENCCFPSELSLTTSNGAVILEQVESDRLTVRTSNGSVSGTVCGAMRDYRIESKTSNGSCNLPNITDHDRPKSLSVITSNARIKVDFTAE